MIFQNYAVWPHMTVYENIAYALRLKRMDKVTIDKIVNDVAGMTNISELLQRLPTQLSGGQQQRVAVARAIAVEPKIFLMDEPLSNLDAKLRVSMRTELKAIHTKTNATTVFVTHDQSEAMSMADRIVIMRNGEIMQIGSPEDVYERSANLFVADFIGTPPTNFIDAEIKRENGSTHLTNPYFDMTLTPEITTLFKAYDRTNLTIGVRPENIILTDQAGATFSAECLVAEPQGSHQVIAFELGDKIIKVIAPPAPKIKSGETIHLAFEPESIRFFDSETTLAISNA
jgi:multiple sugar transport system ATP-binding protein